MCWGPGDPATTMVMLNEHGQLVDMLYAGQLSGSIRRTRRNAQGVDDIFSDPAKVWLQQPSRIMPDRKYSAKMSTKCSGPAFCQVPCCPWKGVSQEQV